RDDGIQFLALNRRTGGSMRTPPHDPPDPRRESGGRLARRWTISPKAATTPRSSRSIARSVDTPAVAHTGPRRPPARRRSRSGRLPSLRTVWTGDLVLLRLLGLLRGLGFLRLFGLLTFGRLGGRCRALDLPDLVDVMPQDARALVVQLLETRARVLDPDVVDVVDSLHLTVAG